MKYIYGIDVGGTTCKMGLFSEEGRLIKKWEIPTDTGNSGGEILPNIAKAIEQCRTARNIYRKDVLGIGIGVPGPVTPDGVVHGCVNLGWKDCNVEKQLSQLTGIAVFVGNDANVAALGEQVAGAGKGKSSVVMITLGTGVGGGIILKQRIVAGNNGAAGEIGHIQVNDKETQACGCGRYGCLEQYASATGLVRSAKQLLASSNEPSCLRELTELTAKDILDGMKAGDIFSEQLVDEMADQLGKVMATVAVVVDPEAFVFGGGVSRAGEPLIKKIKIHYQAHAFKSCKDTEIVLAKLGNEAGIYGAMGMVHNWVR